MKNSVQGLLLVLLAGLGSIFAWADEDERGAAAARDIASQVPNTDIFLLDFDASGEPETSTLRNLTRRAGYDNQPAFLPGGLAILFSRIGDDLQSDIYRLELSDGTVQRLTETSESEYSPTPLADGGFSVVRVETDGTQRLWRYTDQGKPAKMLIPRLDNVGYHRWLSKDRLALFLVAEPVELVLADLSGEKLEPIAAGIGRSFLDDRATGQLYFMNSLPDERWQLCSRDQDSGEISVLIPAPGTSQDMAMDGKGRIWMAADRTLWRWQPGQQEWTPVADFDGGFAANITRLAFSDDGSRMALVAEMGPDSAE
jgi:hypothetical protein